MKKRSVALDLGISAKNTGLGITEENLSKKWNLLISKLIAETVSVSRFQNSLATFYAVRLQ
jgi:hypothetical protein